MKNIIFEFPDHLWWLRSWNLMLKVDFRPQKDEIFDFLKNRDFEPKPFWNDDFAPSSSENFSADAEAQVIISEKIGLKISIFEKVKNLIFLRSETIFKHQIWTPEPSEIVREIKNIIFNDLWKNWFLHPMFTHEWGKDGFRF